MIFGFQAPSLDTVNDKVLEKWNAGKTSESFR